MLKKELGFLGEQIISKKLREDGFTILVQNYRTRRGEIDIIASKENLLSFVEVKLRTNPHVSMFEIVTFKKQKRITSAALDFLRHNPKYLQFLCRFDVALYEQEIDKLTYIPNAFYANQ